MPRRTGDPQTAKRIKDAITQSQFTQNYIAERLRVSQPAISQIATGAIPCNPRTLLRLAKVLNVDPVSLDPTLKPLLQPLRRKRQPDDPFFCPACGSQNTPDEVCADCGTEFAVSNAAS